MELMAGRVEGIISGLLADDHQTFVCHKTLRSERMTCAGAVGVMSKLGRLPLIARLGLVMGQCCGVDGVRPCQRQIARQLHVSGLGDVVGADQGVAAKPADRGDDQDRAIAALGVTAITSPPGSARR